MQHEKLPPFEVSFGKQTIIFQERMLSFAESDEVSARFTEIGPKDADRFKREFTLCRDVLGEFAAAEPKTYETVDGEKVTVPLVPEASTPGEALKTFFADRTPRNERMMRFAYQVFQSQLVPDHRFLDFPADSQGGA